MVRYSESQADLFSLLLGCLAVTTISSINDVGSAWMVIAALLLVPLIVRTACQPQTARELRDWPRAGWLITVLFGVAIGCGLAGIRPAQLFGALAITTLAYLALAALPAWHNRPPR